MGDKSKNIETKGIVTVAVTHGDMMSVLLKYYENNIAKSVERHIFLDVPYCNTSIFMLRKETNQWELIGELADGSHLSLKT